MQQARFFGDVREGAVAVIPVEDILAPATDEKVVETVVVVVADADTGGPDGALEAGFLRDIREGAVPIIPVKAIAGLRGRAVQTRSAGNEDIEPAVVIVIEKGDAAAVGFEDVLLGVRVAVDDGFREAGLRRDVGEPERGRRRGTYGTRQQRGGSSSQELTPFQFSPCQW